MTEVELAGIEPQWIQGTNLQHALPWPAGTCGGTRTPSRSCWS